MSTHGPQHDDFRAQSVDQHGGAAYDERFNNFPAAHTNSHGKLFDKFSQRPGVERYGEKWDEFPWKDMPVLHGTHYDEGFDSPSFDADKHGQLHDVFDGARVRYMYGGQDVEGIVLHTERDFAAVESREGDRHEVAIDQLLAYATAQGNPHADAKPKEATPGNTDTSVVGGPQGERPSGESATAMGGTRKSLDDALEVVKSLAPFDEASFDADVEGLGQDVEKSAAAAGAPGVSHLSTKKLTEAHAKFSDHYAAARIAGSHDRAAFSAQVLAATHAELAHRGVMSGGSPEPSRPSGTVSAVQKTDVEKDVDSQETAVQGEAVSEGANWCKTCQHYCRKVVQGTCPTCGNAVGVKKGWTATLDVLKEMRNPANPWQVEGHPIGYRTSTQKYLCQGCGKKHAQSGEAVALHADDAEAHSYGSCDNCGKAIK